MSQNNINTNEMQQKLLDLIERKGSIKAEEYIAEYFSDPNEGKQLFRKMLREGRVVRLKNGKIANLKVAGYVRGPIEIKREGFGFVRDPLGDVFIPEKQIHGAFQGEEVLAWAGKISSKGREGKVERVLSSLPYRTVGRYHKNKKGRPYVLLENTPEKSRKIYLNGALKKAIHNNDIVVIDIVKRAANGKCAEGKIREVLGKENAPGVDILSIARGYGLYAEFPQKVMQEAGLIPEEVLENELSARELLFDKKIFTIDGVDTKDLDDAISLEKMDNGNYLLGVHIADVSHYVQPDSLLDQEAFHRGTSVYLIDQVIPMLPKRLSNGICSLNEGVIRLTMSCFMEINGQGQVVSRRFSNSAIRSCHQLNYDEINRLLEEKDQIISKKYEDIADILYEMEQLAQILRKKRHEDGNIDFDVPEAKIYLDENKYPIEIKKRVQRTAENLIEEFMICCNNTVAEVFAQANMPFLYRIHDRPDKEKLEALGLFLSNFGYQNLNITNKELQNILEDCTGKAGEHIIKTVALRSMKKAIYSQENHGHFGLGSEAYTHFTSPIRRYPDLIVHRLLKAKMGEAYKSEHSLSEIATQANTTERYAIEAERRIDDIKKAEYMSSHIGETFIGRISGVTSYGLYVELDNTVEGILPLASLRDDYYTYLEAQYCIVGKRTHRRISLGDEIRVTLVLADKRIPRIEFSDAAVPKRRKA